MDYELTMCKRVLGYVAFLGRRYFAQWSCQQASGEETAALSNTVNAVTFGALTVGGFFTGIICNYIGVRWTLVIGTIGYAPYAGMSCARGPGRLLLTLQ